MQSVIFRHFNLSIMPPFLHEATMTTYEAESKIQTYSDPRLNTTRAQTRFLRHQDIVKNDGSHINRFDLFQQHEFLRLFHCHPHHTGKFNLYTAVFISSLIRMG